MRYEDLKGKLGLWRGTRKGGGESCLGTLYKCQQCGAVGCKQSRNDLCWKLRFSVLGHCLKRRPAGQMEAIAAGDYTPQQAWLSGSQSSVS